MLLLHLVDYSSCSSKNKQFSAQIDLFLEMVLWSYCNLQIEQEEEELKTGKSDGFSEIKEIEYQNLKIKLF